MAIILSLLFSLNLLASSDNIKNFLFFGRNREGIFQESFLKTPRFLGAQLVYTWKELEPKKNSYTLNIIKKDLNFLKSNRKKLFIQIQDTTFDPKVVAIPSYLLEDPIYKGGVVLQFDDKGKPEGNVMMRWHPEIQKRFHKLLRVLGKTFDGKIEGINLQETAIGVNESAPGFSYSGYRDSILANMKALKDSFPKSKTLQYANFMPGEWLPQNDRSYLRSVFEYGEKIGVGIGAPDLLPERKNQRNHSYKFIHERTSSIPIGVAVQHGNYTGTTGEDIKPKGAWANLVPNLYDYAKNFLRVDYIFWAPQEPFYSHDLLPFFTDKKGQVK